MSDLPTYDMSQSDLAEQQNLYPPPKIEYPPVADEYRESPNQYPPPSNQYPATQYPPPPNQYGSTHGQYPPPPPLDPAYPASPQNQYPPQRNVYPPTQSHSAVPYQAGQYPKYLNTYCAGRVIKLAPFTQV